MIKLFGPMIKRRIATAFDTWSETYNADVTPKLERRGYSYFKLAEIILTHLNPESRASILEIGTGTGILGKELVTLSPDIDLLGCDISRNMLNRTKLIGAYSYLMQCDAEGSIPLRPDRIKYIYTSFMAHSAMKIQLFLREIKRILKNDATVVVIDLFRTKRRMPFASKFIDNLHSIKYEYGAFSSYHTTNEFIRAAQTCGFSVVGCIKLDSEYKIVKSSAGKMGHYLLKLKPQ